MEWPSRRIPRGGIFNPHRVNFKPETKHFMEMLKEEVKLQTAHRQKDKYFLRNGEPLVKNERKNDSTKQPPVLIRPGTSKRRSREDIINSGAYVRETFRPLVPAIDREKAKKHLQDMLAYGADVQPTPRALQKKTKSEPEVPDDYNRFDEIVKEIGERQEFLKEMEKLGKGGEYREVIQQQVQALVREMTKLKVRGQ